LFDHTNPRPIKSQIVIRFLVTSICVCLALTAIPAAAQDPPSDPSEAARFRFGPVRFTPYLAITEVGTDTNVFNDAEVARRDTTATFGPGVQYWLRAGRSRITARSDVTYTWFKNFDNQRSLNNAHEVKLEVPLARITPFVDGTYQRGRVRPGYEIDTRAFRTDQSGGGGLDVALTSKTTFRVEGHRRRLEYRDDEFFLGSSLQEALSRRTNSIGVSWRQALTPLTTFVVQAEREEERFDFETVRDSTGVRVLPGFEFDPFALIGGKVFVGFRTFDTPSPVVPDFAGLVADVEANYRARATRFDLKLQRDIEYSAEVLEPYYLLTDVGLKITQKITLRWDVVANLGRQWLAYRQADDGIGDTVPARTDTGSRIGGGVGYSFGEALRLGVDIDYYQRSSRRFLRDYDGLRVGGSFTYGLQRQ
jgi:Putative beta-barrel porin 2